MNDHSPAVLLDAATIAARVDALATAMSADYAGVDELLLVGVLQGAFVFLADLGRRLTVPHRVDFVMASSYGAGQRRGELRLLLDLRTEIAGRHVLVVEDIVDTGHTLRHLLDHLAARGPASLKSCVLLRKPECAEVAVAVDYLGFDIPNVWAVGYGLDHDDRFRTLPYVGTID
jgi:hypoxanthine phosphoribosyltransferase